MSMSIQLSKQDNEIAETIDSVMKLLKTGGMNISVTSLEISPGSNSGDNYMSFVKRALIKGRDQYDNGKCP